MDSIRNLTMRQAMFGGGAVVGVVGGIYAALTRGVGHAIGVGIGWWLLGAAAISAVFWIVRLVAALLKRIRS